MPKPTKTRSDKGKPKGLRPANEIVKLATQMHDALAGAAMQFGLPKFCIADRRKLRRIIRLATEQNASTGKREKSAPYTAGAKRRGAKKNAR